MKKEDYIEQQNIHMNARIVNYSIINYEYLISMIVEEL